MVRTKREVSSPDHISETSKKLEKPEWLNWDYGCFGGRLPLPMSPLPLFAWRADNDGCLGGRLGLPMSPLPLST